MQWEFNPTRFPKIIMGQQLQTVLDNEWQMSAGGDSEVIHSIPIGSVFDVKVIDCCHRRRSLDEKSVRLINYEVAPKKEDLSSKETYS